MSRRSKIRIISFATALVLGLGIYSIVTTVQKTDYETQISSLYRESMADLSDTLNDLDGLLQKSAYAVTPYQAIVLATDISQKTASAKAALDRLPVQPEVLAQMSKFLGQTGDYTFVLAKKMISQDTVTDEERANMQQLAARANELSTFVTQLQSEVLDCNADSQEIAQLIENSIAFSESSVSAISLPQEEDDEQLPALPTLIYDGPFSDGVFQKESVFLADKEEVSDEQARQRAAYVLDIAEDRLQMQPPVNGNIQTLHFSSDSGDIYITRKGGYCQSFYRYRPVEEQKVEPADAVYAAQQFLNKIGYVNMQDTYYYIENNVLTANFAYYENGVVCYPDLIKVGVALDDGSVISLEATSYLLNHTSRSPEVMVDREQALEQVADTLDVESDRYAIIPTDGGYEMFCYEFAATAEDGTQILIYINAQTGREEQFLILITDENGTLTV